LDGLADAMLGMEVPDTRVIVMVPDQVDEASLARRRRLHDGRECS
jgi:hypothetical protein